MKKLPIPSLDAPPNLNVIDKAIRFIETGKTRFTCIALQLAAAEIECGVKAGNLWDIPLDVLRRSSAYRDQYAQLIISKWPDTKAPRWWNSPDHYTKARIAALKKFRKACIAAGKQHTQITNRREPK